MIYLDNAATSFPKPESVYQTLDRFARTSLANPGRTSHRMALMAEHVLKDARHRFNQFFHGEGPECFVFTLNGTDGLNAAIKGVVRPGDHVITTNLEHNSVSRPLRRLEKEGVITLTRVEADAGGTVDPEAIRQALTPRTRLVAMTHASNVLGTVQPIAAVGRIAREHGVLFLVDAAQSAGVLPIDVQASCIDMLACPGHKALFGPTGTGLLYVRPGVSISAWREGGTGGDSASEVQPSEWPYFLEGGTPNVLGVAGLLAGLNFVEERGLAALHAHEMNLIDRLARRLDEMPNITIYGHRDWSRHVGTLSFNIEGMAAVDVGAILDTSFDIAIRPGMHCAPYIHRSLGTCPEGMVRVSTGPFNTPEEIDRLTEALRQITA
jgi:cysteine desulfurase/selenocysteine lyase